MKIVFRWLLVVLLVVAAGAVVQGQVQKKAWKTYDDGTLKWFFAEIDKGQTCEVKPGDREAIQGGVVVPKEVVDGATRLRVVALADSAFWKCGGLTSVSLPEGLIAIADYSFYQCAGLPSVSLPAGVTTIGYRAFYECAGLSSLTLPEGLVAIGEEAFSDCTSLPAVSFPSSVKSIGEQSFCRCKAIQRIEIPAGVESIGYDAFQECSALTGFVVDAANEHFSAGDDGVLFDKDKKTLLCYPGGKEGSYAIPQGVTAVGECAFIACSKLTDITFPSGVTAIGNAAFQWCKGITSLVIPEGVTAIEPYTFYRCEKLEKVVFPKGLVTIGEAALQLCAELKEVVIPEGVTTIEESAFAFSGKLSKVSIPTSVVELGRCAFSATGLTSIAIPDGVKTLDATFTNCSKLSSVSIPEGVEVIDFAFALCKSLESVVIPASVVDLTYHSFFKCSALKAVTYLAAADAQVDEDAFDSIADPASLYVRKGEKAKIEANGGDWLKHFQSVEERNVVIFNADGGLPVPALQMVPDGGKVEKPAVDPVKGDLKFVAWLLGAEAYNFDEPVNADMELRAQFVRTNLTVTFTVKDAEGQPLQGVQVTIDGRTVETDAAGRVAIGGLDGGRYSYIATKAGYEEARGDVDLTGGEVSVAVELRKVAGTLVFVVKDAAGVPVPGATVKVDGRTAETDAEGKASVGGLDGGRYSYIATKAGYEEARGDVDLTGGEVSVAVELRKVAGTLVFVVKDAAGVPVPGATVKVDGRTAETDAEGKASVGGLELKGYAYAVAKDGYKAVSGKVELAGSEKVEGVVLVKERTTAVESALLGEARLQVNPFGEVLVLQGVASAERVEVYSVLGVRLHTEQLMRGESVSLNTEDWANGVYVVRLIARDGVKSFKAVKR